MPMLELYSARKRKTAKGGQADVYQYDRLPEPLRVQLQQILPEAIGTYYERVRYGSHENNNNYIWDQIREIICREKGQHALVSEHYNSGQDILNYIAHAATDDVLDVLELACRYVHKAVSEMDEYERQRRGIRVEAADAMAEINHRFREAGVGYQFEGDQIIRVDSEFVHAEVVKPALIVLADDRFKGAQEEFLEAHRQYRAGNPKDAITGANRAFESTMKTVCEIKGWEFKHGARATDLIKVLRSNKLWPDYLDNSFDQLIATLSSGLPEVRNNVGAHGQGSQPIAAPDYVAAYCLHLAATKIVLIANAALGETR